MSDMILHVGRFWLFQVVHCRNAQPVEFSQSLEGLPESCGHGKLDPQVKLGHSCLIRLWLADLPRNSTQQHDHISVRPLLSLQDELHIDQVQATHLG
jgi:hypothetical protein